MDSLVSVVIPVYNEEHNLEELIRRCLDACSQMKRPFEIILVDDGSRDKSASMISAAGARHGGKIVGVLLNRNYGQHSAVMAGFFESRGEIVVTLDADLQNPPEEIPRLIAKMEGGYDVVASQRENRHDPLFRKLASKIINRAAQKSTGVKMTDYGCMLRAYRRHIVNAMLQCHERSTFIPILANSFARMTTEIPVGHSERLKGKSKYSLWKLINLQFDLLTSMTTFPLRMLSIMGVAVAALGIGFGMLLLILRLAYGTEWAAQGVFTLFSILFIFIGAQFIGMGLLGEYIGRIYSDVRARPRYFVQQVVGREKDKDVPEAKKGYDVIL
ncbi:MAG: glycosyltransferase [Planctomycetia bacterium]|nr:glycosyltransferase [Candidatus Brocadia sp.]QOJ05243.1 MAG: glycosyltransferase [Planctomycetia bacterium]TVL96990.1 MAG: undecaprenyl-phosphate 4-deoxy-4-formamido-L-arabinose transferase [Candidatus Brocadia sp. BL1]HQU32193.1 glycosyltransferase [Candidatus Brocadia sapporoensis]